jgi:hypothetical protein
MTPTEQTAPSAFESLAGLAKYVVVRKASPEFYTKHWRSIEFAATFVRHLVSSFPALEPAFQASLAIPPRDGAMSIHRAMSAIEFTQKDLDWFDTQMTEALRTLLPVVRDPDLPGWLSDTRWAIEGAFQ